MAIINRIKTARMVITCTLLLILMSTPALSMDSNSRWHKHSAKNLVLNAKGLAQAYACEIAPTNIGTTEALCFDIPLYNLKNGNRIGILKDALTDFRANPDFPNGIIATVRSHFQFHRDHGKHTLTTEVIGSVQPFLEVSTSMTHLTGFIPGRSDNNIVSGTGRFEHAKGRVRESGAVNLSQFNGAPGSFIEFDLIWMIDFD